MESQTRPGSFYKLACTPNFCFPLFSGANTMCLRGPASRSTRSTGTRAHLHERAPRAKKPQSVLGTPGSVQLAGSKRAQNLQEHVPRAKNPGPATVGLVLGTSDSVPLAGSERALGFRARGSERAHDRREVRRLRAHVPLANTITS
jgi:hypothetical protein